MTVMVSTMLSANTEAIKFSASFVLSLFASFGLNLSFCGTTMDFVFLYVLFVFLSSE